MKKITEKEKQRIVILHESMPMKPWGFKLLNEGYSSVYTSINNREEGDNFRKWVYLVYPNVPNLYGLEKSSEYFHSNSMNNTWNHIDPKTNKSLGDIYLEVNKDRQSYSWGGSSSKPAAPRSSESSSANVTAPSYTFLTEELAEAKKWWKNWLSNTDVMTKFRKLNNLDLMKSLMIYSEYFKIIDNAKLKYFNKFEGKLSSTYAYITCDNPYTINVSNEMMQTKDKSGQVQTMIHEMQHLLYCYFPMTPDKGITQFKSSDQCYEKNKEIYNNTDVTKSERIITLIGKRKDKIAKDLGIDSETVVTHLSDLVFLAYRGWSKDYLLGGADYPANSEFLSRLQAARYFLGVPAGGDITKQQIAKYIKNYNPDAPSTVNPQVDYILANWVLKEFPPLDEYIKDLNTKFVKTDNTNIKQKSPFDLPYKPGEGIV